MKYLQVVIALFSLLPLQAQYSFQSEWSQVDRVWVGPEYWANRLQDWNLNHGQLVCANRMDPMRTIHLLTHRISPKTGSLKVETMVSLPISSEGMYSSGFLIGAGAPDLDYRAAALVHMGMGGAAGIYVGMDQDGRLFIQDLEGSEPVNLAISEPGSWSVPCRLQVELNADEELRLTLLDVNGFALRDISTQITSQISGNVALVAHRVQARFSYWNVEGSKLQEYEDRLAGPVLSTQYTLSEKQLNLTAQCMPIGLKDNRILRLQIKKAGQWIDMASSDINPPAYVAVFKIKNWEDSISHPFRVVYLLKQRDGTERKYAWEGTIRKNPVDQEIISVAGFTGNHNCKHGFGRKDYVFDQNHLWFPHADIVDHVRKHRPDFLFFSGDQVYEGGSPTRVDRDHLMLDYLYKWYLWCWAYRDLTKEIPSAIIPDDHDVYQGNIWGEGGRKTDVDNKGGYVHPAEFARMVEQTQTSNLPDPFDPTPIKQGIGTYYTNIKYGGIGLAVIEDRKFKSGCNGRIVGAASGRPDHINNPDYDISRADVPGLKLLGDRQLAFLEHWAGDWKGEQMKIVLSQTIFANLATHHGANLSRLIADLDSNGWPQSGRNRALAKIRKGFAFMLGGDQHLSTLVHHGIDAHKDAGWSFAVPSVANFYPRGWMPETEGANRNPGDPSYLGDHWDGLKNLVSVYGVTNPPSMTGKSTGMEPLALHDRTPGYGIVKMNKRSRQYIVECWPRYADPAQEGAQQYKGWPRTIHQMDNFGKKATAYLPTLEVSGLENPVVQVINADNQELVYAIRISGTTFRPKVFGPGNYTIRVGDPDQNLWRELKNGRTVIENPEKIRVEF